MSDKYANVIVTVEDMRAVAYCSRGSRAFAERYDLNFMEFITNGLPASTLLELDNALATAAVEAAAKRMGITE